ncbi:MAG: rubredoxin [Mollicutes bacterium]|nr:rubredoxin [Mollicutes bacterium]
MKYRCTLCGYIYDNEKEEIAFNDLPEDWLCPLCGAPKSEFELVEEEKKLN